PGRARAGACAGLTPLRARGIIARACWPSLLARTPRRTKGIASYLNSRRRAMEVLRDRMAEVLKRGWWQLLLRGLAAIAFAVLTWLKPGISLTALIFVFGLYALADGILAIWLAFAGRKMSSSWWMLLLAGLVGVGIGVVS